MSRTRTPYEPTRTVLDFPSSTEYVKNVLDSKAPPYKGGYETEGYSLLPARYSNLKDEKQKKLISNAIVELLDDPDYSCDAIPVAAELGLLEAKDWFLSLTKKSIEEIRNIKTNNYTNALYCLLNYFYNNQDERFLPLIKVILEKSNDRLEIMQALYVLAEVLPDLAQEEIAKHIPLLMKTNNYESKKTSFQQVTHGIFKKHGDIFCVELVKKLKPYLDDETKTIFLKSLEQMGSRFKPYFEELKKILEI